PGTPVAISLNGPPLSAPGLRSKRSMVLGPPFIHNRTQERRRCGWSAASAARRPSQPQVVTPAAAKRSQARRESVCIGAALKNGPRIFDTRIACADEEDQEEEIFILKLFF